jgi:hypothetical protein
MPQAQCEFNQYLESLDGFPTAAGARTPVSASMDGATATVPQNVAVVEARSKRVLSDVVVSFEGTTRYLQVAPGKSWPSGGFVWIGVRGYDSGVRAGGKPVVASLVYNLLKREDSLTCEAATPEAIAENCPYLGLLSQQMSDEAARASLVRLEPLRQAFTRLMGWQVMDEVGGLPKSQAAVVWGFPIHSNPVIDLNPKAQLQPQMTAADEIRLAVNGELDPATVKAFRVFVESGTVYLVNLTALATMAPGPFPAVTASYAGGAITIKGTAPFEPGQTYGIFVSTGVKSPAGKPLVPPPVSVLLMARGRLIDDAGKSTVSSVADLDASVLEIGRQQLAGLFENQLFSAATGIKRENLAYLYAFTLSR